MIHNITKAFILVLAFAICSQISFSQNKMKTEEISSHKNISFVADAKMSKLAVLWTTDNREVALKTAFVYVYNAKRLGWWDTINFIIWGPSAKLLAEDKELQDYLKKMKDEGVILLACRQCADSYGVSEKLDSLGVEVKYMGEPFTDYIKMDWKVLTF